ncbi:MAG: tagatose-6-phosphate kinase [Isosphaeraceae bacterium]|jgi:1-phosphofructokinase family hexose kinase|nr:MAG: tagatose-6-phosphate kinase [Isosphaeraceae bacterium]
MSRAASADAPSDPPSPAPSPFSSGSLLCVTLNPCLDKTLVVPAWLPGDKVRGTQVEEVVGGKGNNVARALKRLGHTQVRPATLLGGAVGRRCVELLRLQDGLDPWTVATEAPTRVILTVRSQDPRTPDTAFFDPDPAITDTEAARFLNPIRAAIQARRIRLLVLAGSSPSPATDRLFAQLVHEAHPASIPTFLDTYGAALTALEPPCPTVIHVNRHEAGQFLGVPSPDLPSLKELLHRWAHGGVRLAAITDGPRPVLAALDGQIVRALPPAVREVNPVGSGDCMLAGLADAWLRRLPPEACLRFGLAAGSANAATWTAGAISRSEVEALAAHVRIEPA